MPQFMDGPSQTKCVLARASYDNIAESPDELAFRRGDVLTVLERNAAGVDGWWLCTLRGRQGICPANRLRVVDQDVDEPDNTVSTLQRQGKRRSWHVQPNKVVTPHKFGDVFLYDLPAGRNVQPRYDVPSSTRSLAEHLANTENMMDSYDVPPHPTAVDSYDVPRPLAVMPQPPSLTPSSSVSSLTADSASAGSNRSSLAAQEYDVPPRPRPSPATPQQQVYDVPPPNPVARSLPLELGSALESLARLETEAHAAASRLLALVTPEWRRRSALEPRLTDVRLGVQRLRSTLHDLAEFTEGALGNAANAPDKGLVVKLRPLVGALRQADLTVAEAVGWMEARGWALDVLCHDPDNPYPQPQPDALDRLVACARALTDDVRRAASYIQGNSTLLFKRGASPCGEWMEDYDYVNLDSKDGAIRDSADVRYNTSLDHQSFDLIVQEAEKISINENRKMDDMMDPSDIQVLTFYLAQCTTHGARLTRAIDAFLHTVEHNQPPKVFVAHGKLVVLSAHKLVHIGDTVHRYVACPDALACADALSDALATTVHKTKRAAQQFPSVAAVQEMVDSVVDISHLARDLRLGLNNWLAALH